MAELAVVGARLVQSHLAVGAVAVRAGAAAPLDVGIPRMPRGRAGFTGVGEVEVLPAPSRRPGVAEFFEELDGNAGLHARVATFGAVQVLRDDAKGTGIVPRVGDHIQLARFTGHPYHLLQ